MEQKAVQTDHAPKAIGPYSQAVRAGSLLYLSGQIGTDAEGNHPDGLIAQTDQAMRNIIDALLGVGGSLDDLAKLTIYVVGWTAAMQGPLFTGLAQAAKVNPIGLVPITLVGCQSLFLDESLIEIEAVAVLPA